MDCFTWSFVILCIIVVAIKIYWKLSIKWNESYTCLTGKTTIVTGGGTGLGYVTALDFAKRGARVILTCENKEKGEDAANRIISATSNKNVVYKHLDLISHESVRAFAEDINANEERLDILVNNAGVYTQNGTILQINHISVFLLTHLLIDKLKKSAPSRIVIVASYAARFSTLNINDVNQLGKTPAKTYFLSETIGYRDSKLCNILFTIELAKKLEGTGVTVNALHPGSANTELFREAFGIIKWVCASIGKLYFLTPEEGAQTQIYLAVSKDVEGVNGKLFTNCTECEMYGNAKVPELARKVWEMTEKWAGLKDNEKL